PDLARAVGERGVSHPGAGPTRAAPLPVGDRRSALHLRLGARLPAALSADRADRANAAAKRAPARDHRDRERPGAGRSRGGARTRARSLAGRPEPAVARVADDFVAQPVRAV